MNTPPSSVARIGQMASGHLCLEFSERVTWDSFPQFADRILSEIGARVTNKADTVEIRIWSVEIGRFHLRLVYDDYPSQASLESDSAEADKLLRQMASQFRSPDSPPSTPRT